MMERNESETRAKREICRGTDEIWTYGSEPQSKLSDFSRTVANTLMTSNGRETERLLNEAIAKIERSVFQKKAGLFGKPSAKSVRQYRDTLQCIDDVYVNLRLRQAGLLKEFKIYEEMEKLIDDCQAELLIYIGIGEKKLTEVSNDLSGGTKEWSARFERKMDELRTTHIIAMQSAAQIRLMKQNNSALTEKINAALTNTIPLWRNQAAAAFGIEQYDNGNQARENTIASAKKIARKNDKEIRKRVKKLRKNQLKEVDPVEIKRLTERLENTLIELGRAEENAREDADQMNEILCKINDTGDPVTLTL